MERKLEKIDLADQVWRERIFAFAAHNFKSIGLDLDAGDDNLTREQLIQAAASLTIRLAIAMDAVLNLASVADQDEIDRRFANAEAAERDIRFFGEAMAQSKENEKWN